MNSRTALAFVDLVDPCDLADLVEDPVAYQDWAWETRFVLSGVESPDVSGLMVEIVALARERLDARAKAEAAAEALAIARVSAVFVERIEAGDIDGAAHLMWDCDVHVTPEWHSARSDAMAELVCCGVTFDWDHEDAGIIALRRVEGCELCGRTDEHEHEKYPQEWHL